MKDLFINLSNNLPGIVYRVFVREDNRIKFFNKAAEKITGYTDAELSGGAVCGIECLMLPEDREKVVYEVSCAVEEDRPFTVEYRLRRKDGDLRCLLEQGTPVYAEDGAPQYIDGVIFDITEQRLAEEALAQVRKEKERLLEGIAASRDGVAFADKDDRYIYLNAAYGAIMGCKPKELVGKTWRDIVPPELLEKAERFVAVDLRNREIGKFISEMPALRKDRSVIPVEVAATALWDANGNYDGHICIVRDITERKDLERTKADFYSMVNHDLKSPLTVLNHYVVMLNGLETGGGPEVREAVEGVMSSARRIAGMVEDFQAVFELTCGPVRLNPFFVDIGGIVMEAKEHFAALARKRGLDLKVEVKNGKLKTVADIKLVSRAVSNLMQNAIKYTPAGGQVSIEAGPEEGGRYACITVTDTGPGIPPGEREKVFEKYYRMHRDSHTKGSGLGLFIVKAVTEAHGGRVELSSAPGEGSTFRIFLPVGNAG